MSDEPRRIEFESLLKPGEHCCIDAIPAQEQAWYNKQHVGLTRVYNKYSSDQLSVSLFLSRYQPNILFIVVCKVEVSNKNAHQNAHYDSSIGRPAKPNMRDVYYTRPFTFIRFLPENWNIGMLTHENPLEVFNNGLTKPLNYEYNK
jgi:hypothetical protein